MLCGKKIILGVTGSIAAYKTAHLTRLLVEAKAEVRVILTPAAKEFISPLTLATLSKNPVHMRFVRNTTGEWNNHVAMGQWADVLLIAPASANSIAKMAQGLCDNLLLATYLSSQCPVFFAPAMDFDMWQHPATKKNIKILKSYNLICIEPQHGELASGMVGVGRMEEPEAIIQYLEGYFKKRERLAGKEVLITAGPTQERIDAVRFIGNYASGKMGFAIAEAMANEGANVTLVSGPTACTTSHPNITLQRVESAEDMLSKCKSVFPKTSVTVLSAAVADYRPSLQVNHKMKKGAERITMNLAKTPDIAAILGKAKKKGQVVVGFALESENEEANAKEKIMSKNLDFIVLNSLNDEGAGFNHDTNKVSLIDRKGGILRFELKHKRAVANDIVETIIRDYV